MKANSEVVTCCIICLLLALFIKFADEIVTVGLFIYFGVPIIIAIVILLYVLYGITKFILYELRYSNDEQYRAEQDAITAEQEKIEYDKRLVEEETQRQSNHEDAIAVVTAPFKLIGWVSWKAFQIFTGDFGDNKK